MTNLAQKTKLTELENKIPDVSSLATKTALPDVSSLVKKTDYDKKLLKQKKILLTKIMIYILLLQNLILGVFNVKLKQTNSI